jgi:hypothetical protein
MSGKDILDLLNKFYYLENIMKPHIKVKNHRCNTNRMIGISEIYILVKKWINFIFVAIGVGSNYY